MPVARGGALGRTRWRVRRRGRAAALAAVLSAALVLVAGCGSADREQDDRPLVLTTFTVIADIAQNVAGPHLRVESLIEPGQEIHSYEPTPGDVRLARDAALVLDHGMGLEAWFEQFMADVDAPRVQVSAGIEPIDIASDAYAGRPNPHTWMSPENVQRYTDTIAEAFGTLDPENTQAYLDSAATYRGHLEQVLDDLRATVQEIPERQRVLVTCEGAFSYLARDTGLQEYYLWPVNAESEATPGRIAAVIDVVNEYRVPAVFCESTVSDAAMRQVAEATDARLAGPLYVDSLTGPDGDAPTYLDLIRHDAQAIAAGLGSG